MNQKRTAAALLGGLLALSAGAATAATASSSRPTASIHPSATPQTTPTTAATPLTHPQMMVPGQSDLAMAASTSPTTPTTVAATTAPSVAATTTAPSITPASLPSGTTVLPVAADSGAGCSAGITDGAQWIRYTVHPGDTLSTIAACFSLNGYQMLYQENEGVLGANPNLIFPGQVVTIVNGKMSVGSK